MTGDSLAGGQSSRFNRADRQNPELTSHFLFPKTVQESPVLCRDLQFGEFESFPEMSSKSCLILPLRKSSPRKTGRGYC